MVLKTRTVQTLTDVKEFCYNVAQEMLKLRKLFENAEKILKQ